MPWLPFYADQADFDWVLTWLNGESDIAWIVGDGPKRWRAVPELEAAGQGMLCLWHVPSGPLPLVLPETRKPWWDPLRRLGRSSVVSDPWAGWEERLTGADPSQPYFGDHPGVISLSVRIQGGDGPGAIGMSSFGWIGNYYRIIGKGAPEVTEKWWQRLRRQIKKRGVRIPREGPIDGPNAEIWALPSALKRIRDGTIRDMNPV